MRLAALLRSAFSRNNERPGRTDARTPELFRRIEGIQTGRACAGARVDFAGAKMSCGRRESPIAARKKNTWTWLNSVRPISRPVAQLCRERLVRWRIFPVSQSPNARSDPPLLHTLVEEREGEKRVLFGQTVSSPVAVRHGLHFLPTNDINASPPQPSPPLRGREGDRSLRQTCAVRHP
jgi:hypothetical protein